MHTIPESIQQRAIASLASLYALRMLGLFMVLPVLVLEGQNLDGATPTLLGLAMGIYGLSQALLQIPAGALSDRFGRKTVIIGGLLIFAAGSLIAAMASSIEWLIIGRALQGCGAIASAIMALVTDLTSEEKRTRAMAFIGASIGLSFSIALVLGPFLSGLGGLTLIFGLTGVLALLGILVVVFLIPSPPAVRHRDSSAIGSEILKQLKNPSLWPINFGIFLLHMLMVCIFIVIPLRLEDAGLTSTHHSYLYLPVLLVAFVLMIPLIIVAEKREKMKPIVLIASLLVASVLLLMASASSLWGWGVLLLLYFLGFNLLEASLPSWLSKLAPAGSKGSAMGIYSSMQFLGAFIGGSIGGWLMSTIGPAWLFYILATLFLIWLLVMLKTPAPLHLTSVRLALSRPLDIQQLQSLKALSGVHELIEPANEKAAYLKVFASDFCHEEALAIVKIEGESNGSQCK